MRHRKKSEKFSRPRAQRKALIKALSKAVIINERIITTVSRAKYLRREIDHLITLGKKGTLHHKRLAYIKLGDHSLVKRLFEVIAPRFANISGGYSRAITLGRRRGDGALLSLFELTRIIKKPKGHKEHKRQDKEVPSEEKEKKLAPKKEKKPKKGVVSGVKKIFKKERDAL